MLKVLSETDVLTWSLSTARPVISMALSHDIWLSSISYHMIFDNDMILHDIDIIYLKYGRGAGTWYGSSNTATVVCATKGGTVELNIL